LTESANPFVLVMGVAACGKSTVGTLLAARLGLPFHDADDYHPPENRAKMAADIPLCDADRGPWLEQLSELAGSWQSQGGAVLACSALKQSYREVLLKHTRAPHLIYLELARAEAELRLEARRGQHVIVGEFKRLLDGQYRDLEPPTDALTVPANQALSAIVEQAAAYVGQPRA
jgi:gluconokinase